MKDGEIWAVEILLESGKWEVQNTFTLRKYVDKAIKSHYLEITPDLKYRVVKYVRQEVKNGRT